MEYGHMSLSEFESLLGLSADVISIAQELLGGLKRHGGVVD
jgi:hypothetical protein